MSQVLLCLHGWGGSKESFAQLREALNDSDVNILTPDLPGFGSEPEPDKPWNVDDYADWVESWLAIQNSKFKIQNSSYLLLGHSHGGRIALKIAARQATNNEQRATNNMHIAHLYLCAAAGIRHPRILRRSLGFLMAKSGKALLRIPGLRRLEPLGKQLLYKVLRVHDYERASSVMRETLQRVRDEDLTPLLSTITIPTDIFWGTKDSMTPFADGLFMHKRIKGSTLHTFPGMRHGIHRTNASAIADVIQSHIRQQDEHVHEVHGRENKSRSNMLHR